MGFAELAAGRALMLADASRLMLSNFEGFELRTKPSKPKAIHRVVHSNQHDFRTPQHE